MHPVVEPHVPALTGLRAIAAWMVFFHHFRISSEYVGAVLFNMQAQAHVGVSVFFVLSGFLIAYQYADRLGLQARDVLDFLRNRFARLYPMYALCTLVTLVYIDNFEVTTWLLSFTLLRGFFGDFYFFHIGQAWSLSVEMTFYLLAPWLLLLVGRVPVGLLCLVFYAAGWLLMQVDMPIPTFMEPPRMVVANTFFGRCFEFLLGIWLFKRFRDVAPWRHALCTWGGLGSIILFLYFSAFADGLTVYSVNWSPAHHFLFPLLVATLILGLWKEHSALKRLLGSRLFVVLGMASYVFYLIQAAPFREIFGLDEVPVLVHFLATNLFAILGYYLLERPCHSWLRSPRRPPSDAGPNVLREPAAAG